jgi:hypothetical protein
MAEGLAVTGPEFDDIVQETPGVWFVAAMLIVGGAIAVCLYLLARMAWALTACFA